MIINSFDLGSYISLTFETDLPSNLGSALANGSATTNPVSINIHNSDAVGEDDPDLALPVATANLVSIQKDETVDLYRFYLTDIDFIDSTKSFSDFTTVNLRIGSQKLASGNASSFTSSVDSSLIFPVEKGTTVKTLRGLEIQN